jgi:hypothetical protein
METNPERKKQSAIEFAKEKLNLNPEASYADIKAQAKFEGIPIFPVVYGRAKALLGLVPTAPYGSKSKARKQAALEKAELAAQEDRAAKAAAAAAAASTAAGTPNAGTTNAGTTNAGTTDAGTNGNGNGNGGSSRTSRAKALDPAAGLEAMIEDLRTAVQERDRYRAVLEKITEMIRAEIDPDS